MANPIYAIQNPAGATIATVFPLFTLTMPIYHPKARPL